MSTGITRILSPRIKMLLAVVGAALLGAGAGALPTLLSREDASLPQATAAELLNQVWQEEKNCTMEAAIATDNMRRLALLAGDSEQLKKKDQEGNTPLHLAALAGQADMVYVLQYNGADPFAKNNIGHTPLDLAVDTATRNACLFGQAMRQHEQELIADMGRGLTPDAAIIRALRSGANPNVRRPDGQITLLGQAIRKGASESVVRLLLQAGADPNAVQESGVQPLHQAASAGRRDIIPLLIQAGSDPYAHQHNDATPIHNAVWNKDAATLKAMLPYYANVNFSPHSYTNGFLPHMIITMESPEMFQIILDAGMRVNDYMFKDYPLLIQAARRNTPRIVEMLLKAGADKNARNRDGKTAIDYAQGEVLELLR